MCGGRSAQALLNHHASAVIQHTTTILALLVRRPHPTSHEDIAVQCQLLIKYCSCTAWLPCWSHGAKSTLHRSCCLLLLLLAAASVSAALFINIHTPTPASNSGFCCSHNAARGRSFRPRSLVATPHVHYCTVIAFSSLRTACIFRNSSLPFPLSLHISPASQGARRISGTHSLHSSTAPSY